MPATSKQDRPGWEAARRYGKGAVQTVLPNQFQGDGKSRARSVEEIHPTHNLSLGERQQRRRSGDSSEYKQKKNVYIKLAEAVSMRCEEKLRGRSEYPITNTDMVHPP
jgi:hypothetical protein